MRLGKWGRWVTARVARRMGRTARKYVAPVLPALITPMAIGAGLSAGALTLFFHIADDVRDTDGVWHFDHDGLHLAHSLRTPRRTLLMRGASALARPDVMSGLGIVAIAISRLSPALQPKGILLAITLTGGGGIIGGIKHRFARERPSVIEALAKEGTFSFPSGHAFISLCFYGVLASWWVRSRTDWFRRSVVSVAAANGILLIGASRVYLGVHYPSDVLAGYAAAIPWLTACLSAYSRYEKRIAPLLPAAPVATTP